MRLLLGSGRTKAWNRANTRKHVAQKTCEMCGLAARFEKSGPLENHDAEVPYHLMTDTQKNDEQFIYDNLLTLHHFEHRADGHCGDPNCLRYNPDIRAFAAISLDYKQYCTS